MSKSLNGHGNLYVIAAPSGTGKTTLVAALLNHIPDLLVSISYTTRAKRPDEIEGIHYHYIDDATFNAMIKHADFLEHAHIFGHQYGTSKSWVEKNLARGRDVILEIDWQGHQQIKRLFPQAIGIFIFPPDLTSLRARLTTRNQDQPAVIAERFADAELTLSHAQEFDYLVLNENIEHALADLSTIIRAGRLQTHRQIQHLTHAP